MTLEDLLTGDFLKEYIKQGGTVIDWVSFIWTDKLKETS